MGCLSGRTHQSSAFVDCCLAEVSSSLMYVRCSNRSCSGWKVRIEGRFNVCSGFTDSVTACLTVASGFNRVFLLMSWTMARFVESQRVVIRARIFFLFLSPFLWRSTDPVPGRKHQGCVQWLRYWRSVQMLTEWLFFSLSAWFKAISLAFWDGDWAQIISFSVTTVVPAYLIPFVHNCFY